MMELIKELIQKTDRKKKLAPRMPFPMCGPLGRGATLQLTFQLVGRTQEDQQRSVPTRGWGAEA